MIWDSQGRGQRVEPRMETMRGAEAGEVRMVGGAPRSLHWHWEWKSGLLGHSVAKFNMVPIYAAFCLPLFFLSGFFL